MFIIKKNGKKTVRKTFPTYEEARSYARKLIRKNDVFYSWDCFWRNPNLTEYGYSITKV